MSYARTGNWSWMYFPPPYDFLAPAPIVPFNGVVLPEERNQMEGPQSFAKNGLNGLRGLGCGPSCGCSPCQAAAGGLGDDTTTANPLLTDFQNFGTDLSTSLSTSGSSLLQPLSDTIAGVPAWMWLAGVGAIYWVYSQEMTGGKRRRR